MAEISELIKKIIPSPGLFLLVEKDTGTPIKNGTGQLIKDQAEAKEVYRIYAAAQNNSVELIEEAELLLEHGHFARAFALAVTAFEELGKSQIAADYYTGIISKDQYERCFRVHEKTSYAARMMKIPQGEAKEGGLAAFDNVSKLLEKMRQDALYVSPTNNPNEVFEKKDAECLIQEVRSHIEYINYAEWLNGRIGSKALFR